MEVDPGVYGVVGGASASELSADWVADTGALGAARGRSRVRTLYNPWRTAPRVGDGDGRLHLYPYRGVEEKDLPMELLDWGVYCPEMHVPSAPPDAVAGHPVVQAARALRQVHAVLRVLEARRGLWGHHGCTAEQVASCEQLVAAAARAGKEVADVVKSGQLLQGTGPQAHRALCNELGRVLALLQERVNDIHARGVCEVNERTAHTRAIAEQEAMALAEEARVTHTQTVARNVLAWKSARQAHRRTDACAMSCECESKGV